MAVHWPVGIRDRGSIGRQFHHLIDVAPTILECAGVPEPTRVNGVDQKSLEGVSMRYTFDDPTATDRHTTQYFELLGGRAIYQDGWWAGTRHGVDGVTAAKRAVPFDEDVWELYDMRTDFGHANDLAAEHPAKLAELQALFDREARKYNVYPMADNIGELLTAERPRLVSGNEASYGPGTIRLPEDAVINIKNRSFSIVAEVDNPVGNAEGVLVTLGGETGGYALLVLEGKAKSSTTFLAWSGTRSRRRQRFPRARARFGSTSPTTVAARAGAARARCRSTARRWPKAGSRKRCRSTSQPTTPSTWEKTGERPCRRPTSLRSPSPAF